MPESTYLLKVQSGPQSGRIHPLTKASVLIGRYPLADIHIDDPGIAYRHAVLTQVEATYTIADLASEAGTYVNGQRIGAEPVALAPGDMILLGPQISAAFLTSAGEPVTPLHEVADSQAPSVERPGDISSAPTLEVPTAESKSMESVTAESQYEPPVGEAENPVEPVAAPFIYQSAPPQPIHAEPLPPLPPPQKNNNGRIVLIAAGCLILLLACCSVTLFMYFVGGDWLLYRMGFLP